MEDVSLRLDGSVAYITFIRPNSYNSLRHQTFAELNIALRQVAENEDIVLTVITGEGKFFSSGADFNEISSNNSGASDVSEVRRASRCSLEQGPVEAARLLIDHPKVVLIALNGPVIGWPAGWIANADIILAAQSATLHALFSQLGLCPEGGSSFAFVQRMGMGPASEALICARKFSATELAATGFVNRVFPDATFSGDVKAYIDDMLQRNIGNSMLAAKKLLREHTRGVAKLAVGDECTMLIERFVSGDPIQAFMKMAAEAAKRRTARL